jgi:hypothetical protein
MGTDSGVSAGSGGRKGQGICLGTNMPTDSWPCSQYSISISPFPTNCTLANLMQEKDKFGGNCVDLG